MTIAAGIGALLLAAVHFWVDHLKFSKIPRSKWLSAAGGISVAYVFVHVLPELNEWQETFAESTSAEIIQFFEHHLYLLAMLGLASFYGLERAARISGESKRESDEKENRYNTKIFWIHIFSFAVYNFLIGYLLIHRENESYYSLATFTVAMIFHFVVNDFGLLDHYEQTYQHKGRWLLAAAVLVGWAVGALTEIRELYISIIFAFVAGGIIMNVLKEELPEERKSNFPYFMLGIGLYSALLLINVNV